MSQVEQAKTKLKRAINKLQKIIQARIDELEVENSNLRTQIVQLKQEILMLKKANNDTGKQPDLLEDDELTLNELKKIAG